MDQTIIKTIADIKKEITDGEVLQVRLLFDPLADGIQTLRSPEFILTEFLEGHFLYFRRK